MIPLLPFIRKNGYSYTQVCRGQRSCIYAQHVTPTLTRFEVFLITIAPEKTINGTFIESRERFPKNEDFGVTAWTYWDKDNAKKRFRRLEDGENSIYS